MTTKQELTVDLKKMFVSSLKQVNETFNFTPLLLLAKGFFFSNHFFIKLE